MRFLSTEQLDNYRKKLNEENPTEGGTAVCLFGVYESLHAPVVKFVKITKRYIYDINDEKHHYLTNGLSIFTSSNEAWKYFHNRLEKRKKEFEKYFEIEKNSIDKASKIVQDKIKDCPELFL